MSEEKEDRVTARTFVKRLVQAKGNKIIVLSDKEFNDLAMLMAEYPGLVKKADELVEPRQFVLTDF